VPGWIAGTVRVGVACSAREGVSDEPAAGFPARAVAGFASGTLGTDEGVVARDAPAGGELTAEVVGAPAMAFDEPAVAAGVAPRAGVVVAGTPGEALAADGAAFAGAGAEP
jgi:hypothetical protein